MVRNEIYPAVRRYRDYLKDEYRDRYKTYRTDAALRGGVGSAEVDQYVEVRVGPVVRMHVDTHVCQRYSVERHADRCLVAGVRDRTGTSLR